MMWIFIAHCRKDEANQMLALLMRHRLLMRKNRKEGRCYLTCRAVAVY
ncbi:hypothetical protein KCP69_14965 [Salmonella enterica subsp. enterica]|nr:hypothetical protein KCP69_14965 [Salmonella enterica subsp. enterica]